MIKYKGPEKLRDEILDKCGKLVSLDEVNIMIFQDYCEKRTNTIGSGVVIESESNIYPCAIPDVGCGFHLCRIEGIRRNDIKNNKILYDKMMELYYGEKKNFSSGKFSLIEMCEKGHLYAKSSFDDDRKSKYEEEKVALQKPISSLFRNCNCCGDLDQYQGHFFEFLEDDNQNIYLLIHSGSWVLADRIMKKYWMPMARESYKKGWSVKENIINGHFRIPIEGMHTLFPEYYNDILSLYNFTIAYRDVIEKEISDIFNEVFGKMISFCLESDYSHTKLWIADDNKVIHQRGVQHLRGDGITRYIMCGTQSSPSLIFTLDRDEFFSHGISEEIHGSDLICFNYTLEKAVRGEQLCPIMTIK
ncbi:MAG: hypothetical protein RSD97_08920 [Lachnospiraceae bacterium]